MKTSLVQEGTNRLGSVTVLLQREMLLPQCRQQLARALKVTHLVSQHRMRSTNWNGMFNIYISVSVRVYDIYTHIYTYIY